MWHLEQEDQELGSAAEGCRQLTTTFREGVRRAKTPNTRTSVFSSLAGAPHGVNPTETDSEGFCRKSCSPGQGAGDRRVESPLEGAQGHSQHGQPAARVEGAPSSPSGTGAEVSVVVAVGRPEGPGSVLPPTVSVQDLISQVGSQL